VSAELAGPLHRVRFADGSELAADIPRDTLDPRWRACLAHHLACDCREAEFSEYRMEVRGEIEHIRKAFNDVLGGHLTYPHELGDVTCECTGCRIARRTHHRYFESLELRRTRPREEWIVMTDHAPETTTAPAKPEPTPAVDETAAMRRAYDALRGLDQAAQYRVMRWLNDRLADDRRASADPYDQEPPF
jgi:hypothetical protein